MNSNNPGIQSRQPVWLIAFLLFFLTLDLPADWINLTGAETSPNIAEITVLDDRIQVALEIYVGDLENFSALVPDDWLKEQGTERPPLAKRLREFSANGLSFAYASGQPRVYPYLLRSSIFKFCGSKASSACSDLAAGSFSNR